MRGRNFKGSTVLNGRQYAIRVEGTVIHFECAKAGHAYKINFGKKPLARRLGETACKLMARWWSKERGGCIGACPKCEKLTKAGVP